MLYDIIDANICSTLFSAMVRRLHQFKNLTVQEYRIILKSCLGLLATGSSLICLVPYADYIEG